MLRLIDTHTHLEGVKNLALTLKEAKSLGVVAIVTVGSDLKSSQQALKLSQKYASFVYPALGLHPWEIGNLKPEQLKKTLEFTERNINLCVAIGEIGLDYDKRVLKASTEEKQKAVLKSLLELAKKYEKPAIIHARYAWQDAFQIVRETKIVHAVFHWYTGPAKLLHEIITSGYFISATPAAEYHDEHRQAIKEVPLDNLLLETDSPVRYGRETKYESCPAHITRVLKAVAAVKEIEEKTIAEQTTKNAIKFFGLRSY